MTQQQRPTPAQARVLERLAAGETIDLGTFMRPYLNSPGNRFRDAIMGPTFEAIKRHEWIEVIPDTGRSRLSYRITAAGRAALAATAAPSTGKEGR